MVNFPQPQAQAQPRPQNRKNGINFLKTLINLIITFYVADFKVFSM